jgi:hypothetical protein
MQNPLPTKSTLSGECEFPIVTTLALGSRPKQGLAKVRAKSEAQESHFMLSGVWGSVGECEGMNFHTPK